MSKLNLIERPLKVEITLLIVQIIFVSFAESQTRPSDQDSNQNIDSYLHTNSYHIVEPVTSQSFDHHHQQLNDGQPQNNQQFDPELSGSFNIKNNHSDADYYYPESINNNNSNHLNHENTDLLSMTDRLIEKEFLTQGLSEMACGLDRGCQRKDRLNNTYLTYCSRYKLESLLSNEILMSIMHDSSGECERILDEFMQLDRLINQFDGFFKTLLMRYNCHNGYSVKWNCDDCKVSISSR